MRVEEAVQSAKNWLTLIMKDEGLINLGLEEVVFDDEHQAWQITLGFSRPWNSVRNAMTVIGGEATPRRAFRVLSVRDADGAVLSMVKPKQSDD